MRCHFAASRQAAAHSLPSSFDFSLIYLIPPCKLVTASKASGTDYNISIISRWLFSEVDDPYFDSDLISSSDCSNKDVWSNEASRIFMPI